MDCGQTLAAWHVLSCLFYLSVLLRQLARHFVGCSSSVNDIQQLLLVGVSSLQSVQLSLVAGTWPRAMCLVFI